MSTQFQLPPRANAREHDPAVAAPHHDMPGTEPWLKISIAGIVPLMLAFLLPAAYRPILLAAGGLLVLCGIAMLVRQERRKSSGARE